VQRLQHKDVREFLADLQRFARRQPAVFIGAAFAVGVISARFLKSSAEPGRRSDAEPPRGPGDRYTEPSRGSGVRPYTDPSRFGTSGAPGTAM
jgi:hypothetical protein